LPLGNNAVMKGIFVDIITMIAQSFPIEHQVARGAAEVVKEALQEVANGLDAELMADPRTTSMVVAKSAVFRSCQWPDNGVEGVYMVSPAGQVVRVRIDAFPLEDVANALANDSDVDDVLAYVHDVAVKLDANNK
jgi:hypothetical protein